MRASRLGAQVGIKCHVSLLTKCVQKVKPTAISIGLMERTSVLIMSAGKLDRDLQIFSHLMGMASHNNVPLLK